MSNNLVPKVTLEESASASGVPQGNQVVIGIIGVSEQGTAGVVKKILSVSQAESTFGTNTAFGATLVKMIKRAFQEGASIVKAVSVGTPTLAGATDDHAGALTSDAEAGQSEISVDDATIYEEGDVVYLGTGSSYDKEERLVVDTASGTTVSFTTNLRFDHYAGEEAVIVTTKDSDDYEDAITALKSDEDKSIVICDLNDDETASLLKTMCIDSTNEHNTPCVYIRAPHWGENSAAVIANGTAQNSSRVIQLWPLLTEFNGNVTTPGETAAVVAGAIAGNGIPKLNHNFTSFTTVGGVEASITDMDSFISAGVTPIELKYGTIHIVRFVTTKTTEDGVPTTTWTEGAIRLNVDALEKLLAKQIQVKFLQKGNTVETRLAIQQEVVSILDNFTSQNILVGDSTRNIPAYRTPGVSVDANDDTKVNVEIEVSPGKPLNFINLQFKVVL